MILISNDRWNSLKIATEHDLIKWLSKCEGSLQKSKEKNTIKMMNDDEHESNRKIRRR